MKFLADMGIAQSTVKWLVEQGHEATHVRDLNLNRASRVTSISGISWQLAERNHLALSSSDWKTVDLAISIDDCSKYCRNLLLHYLKAPLSLWKMQGTE
jgi:predicted nuclease of predicted toxin-antitoxin system